MTNQDKKYVAILECSNGNDTVGNMWLESYICDSKTTIEEIMKWRSEKNGAKGKLIISQASKIKIDRKDGIPF